ncbi:isomerase DpgB [Streptomyces tendae]|uniref:enoyl-CoA-hydratase DpgB n=1 Tax=Streptomyces tendae TaxID=1932 RepID=UPI0038324122
MITNSTTAGIDNDLAIRIDGAAPWSPETIAALAALCDRAEDHGGPGIVTVQVSGTPDDSWSRAMSVPLVNKWERAVRRLERLSMTTVAVAAGDCGGPALDVLLATDYRIAAPTVRLMVPVADGVTWPGMAVYRLAQQAGIARVRRAVLFGIAVEADEALGLHLVDQLAEDPLVVLAQSPELLATLSRPELAIRRQLMFDAATTSFEDALGSHLAACDRQLRRATTGALS